ncbi:hypothetical protein GCM10010123_12850 [Pilimelia anulata]|uniref:Peptidase inhibitor family I36 n=1 Tax=Pilimelia anulata TaxID=53371 RepID=A0A8J3B4I6_9ACTN|nr:peptidase inhibitor family I36 protein [Pilimelia anulata]GGJ84653.1 hypothetical protein GCM10010123_12850 [Pilimelia anulata]
MSLRRIAATGLAALGLGAATLLATAAPAAAGLGDCPARHTCIWVDANFNGGHWAKSGYTQYSDVPGWMHDKGSSWANKNVNQRECIFDWVNGSRIILGNLGPGQNVGWPGDGANDRTDAAGWC